MNIRTKMVATEASWAPVSLPCEPWMKPEAPKTKAVTPETIRTDDATEKITDALRQGQTQFDAILKTAFGKRNGAAEDLGRTVLNKMLSDGTVTRERSNAIGKPFIWRLTIE